MSKNKKAPIFALAFGKEARSMPEGRVASRRERSLRELIETAAADYEVGHTRKGKEKPSTNTASGLRKKIKITISTTESLILAQDER